MILVINTGSSSVKFTLFGADQCRQLAKGLIERIATPHARLKYSNNRNQHRETKIQAHSYEEAIQRACEALMDPDLGVITSLEHIRGIGHRVVHGGATISDSVRITPDIKKVIVDCYDVAPIHNPPNYDGIIACERIFAGVPMVAVFDTAFHQTMPPAAYTYAIPADLAEHYRIRRYGFHGTSHKYVAYRTAELLGRPLEELKLITAHLGNGCSITAVRNGRVADTSMGLTPLEGLVMGTRSGDLDPSVVITLLRKGLGVDEVDKLLNKHSGLLALAGIDSGDMRDVLAARAAGNPRAVMAFEVFCLRLVKYVGAYAAELNGVDAVVFTGGIGENVPVVRSEVCGHLGFMGVNLDPARNEANAQVITTDDSRMRVMVVPTNEELMIAQETLRVLFHTRTGGGQAATPA